MRISDWSSDVCSSDLRYVINNLDFPDIRGIYQLQAEGLPDIEMTVSGSPVKPEVQVKTGEETAKATFGKTGELFIILANLDEAAGGTVRLSGLRSEEHTSELQSLMRISYAVFCLKKKNIKTEQTKIDM